MGKTIQQRSRQPFAAQHFGPLFEGQIGGDDRVQSKMESRQREFQKDLTRDIEADRRKYEGSIEADRRKYEMTVENAQAKYNDAWNVANRDRENEIKNDIKRIADALEKISKPG